MIPLYILQGIETGCQRVCYIFFNEIKFFADLYHIDLWLITVSRRHIFAAHFFEKRQTALTIVIIISVNYVISCNFG